MIKNLNKVKTLNLLFPVFAVALLLNGCASTSSRYKQSSDSLPRDYQNFDVSKIPNATPVITPLSRYGNPSSYVVLGHRYTVLKSAAGYKEKGIASFYGAKFHNYRTSNGEIYNMYGMTAANKVLPLPTYVKVTNLENQRWVIVKVNDRGPFHVNRIIDLSFAAAKKLGMLSKGTALVEVEAIDLRHPGKDSIALKTNKHPKLYLQMGAFKQASNATRLEARLHQYTEHPTRIITTNTNHHKLYRVQIGPLKNVEETDALSLILEKHGLGRAFVTVN